jgi:hypothetical protein
MRAAVVGVVGVVALNGAHKVPQLVLQASAAAETHAHVKMLTPISVIKQESLQSRSHEQPKECTTCINENKVSNQSITSTCGRPSSSMSPSCCSTAMLTASSGCLLVKAASLNTSKPSQLKTCSSSSSSSRSEAARHEARRYESTTCSKGHWWCRMFLGWHVSDHTADEHNPSSPRDAWDPMLAGICAA